MVRLYAKFTKLGVFLLILFVLFSLVASVAIYWLYKKENQEGTNQPVQTTIPETTPVTVNIPLSDAKNRVTKKHFGQYITPQNSLVQPEKFTGYHTGADFEIKPEELNAKVIVYAICDGPIKIKQFVSGYGGVVVQACTIEGQLAQVLYGHISLSEGFGAGSIIKSGDIVTVLAPDKSTDSAGERKHLHLGIIRGSTIDYRGYVSSSSELSKWINPEIYLGIN